MTEQPQADAPRKPVTNHQVLPCAKQSCKLCHGAGYYHAADGDHLCGCAVRRFAKAYAGRIYRDDKGAWWHAGAAPDDVSIG